MFRAVILTGILACDIEWPGLAADATAGPAVREPPVEQDRGTASNPYTPVAADRSVSIVVPWGDCTCPESASAAPSPSRVRTVRLVDSGALRPGTLEAIADEILRFTGGRRIDVNETIAAEADSAGNAGPVYVLLRPGDAPSPARAPPARAGRPDDAPLAWVPFQQNQPPSHVFVWVAAVQRLLDTSRIEGRPFTHWRADLRRALLARALGRVSAHEIGHLMCGRLHAADGLMKRRFHTDDLLWNTTWLTTGGPRPACGDLPPD